MLTSFQDQQPVQKHHTELYLYIPASIYFMEKRLSKSVVAKQPGTHRIIFFKENDGTLHLRKHFVRAYSNDVFLLSPEAQCSIQFSNSSLNYPAGNFSENTPLSAPVIVLDFYAYRIGDLEPTTEITHLLPYETRISIADESKFLHLLEKLHDCLNHSTANLESEKLKQQIHMQELILLLIENREREQTVSDTYQAIKHTIAYIEQNYRQNITVQQLYRIAGVAKWQYSALFQSLTGKKPLDYLLNIRMIQAKKLLLQTNDTLAQIAEAVGFKDESYFVRKFKQETGMTPRQYVVITPRNFSDSENETLPYKRVAAIGYSLGDLLSLGIQPIGADTEIIGKRVIYREALEGIQDIGLLGEPAKIRKLQPDLIVHSGFRQDWIDELALIAPTVLIDRYESVYDRFLKIADVFNKRELAQNWIEFHQVASRQMWMELADQLPSKQSATVFSMVEGSLYVMGMKGFAVTIYHPNGYKPSSQVKNLIDAGIPFQLVALEHAHSYRAGTFFMLTDDHPLSRLNYDKLFEEEYWRNSRKSQIYFSKNKWNFDDPLTMDKLLIELPILIRQGRH
ncbi:helix-turn-helix domain-containing protein [Lysinibacillus sp. NPDC093712]|uniref:helix-turn-helix domain-containing protein n=1 Tax=Lysinibacillus sp. NPDC093712 TaxID=3390579 RepID=UPI003CFDA657